MQVWWVPLLFFVVSFGTISLSCSLAFARGDARGIPHISQCGMHQPERTIFGIGEIQITRVYEHTEDQEIGVHVALAYLLH